MDRENLVREIHYYQFRFIDVYVELIKSNTRYHGFLKVHTSIYPINKIGEWKNISDTEGNVLKIIIGDEATYKNHLSGRFLEFEIDNRVYPNSRNCDLSHMSLAQLPDAVLYHTYNPYKKKHGDIEMRLRIPASHYVFKNWDAAKELKKITESRLVHSGYIKNYHNDIDYSVTNIKHPFQGGLVNPK